MPGIKTANYKTDGGALALIRISALDYAVQGNTEPAGNPGFYIYNRRAGRKLGYSVRRLVLKRLLRAGDEAAGIPDQFDTKYVTLMDPASAANFTRGDAVAYGGKNYVFDKVQPETRT